MINNKKLQEAVLHYAKNDDKVRAVIQGGSRSNKSTAMDLLQDFDITYAVANPLHFMDSDFLKEIGEPMLIRQYDKRDPDHPEGDYIVYRVIFQNYTRLDLTILPVETFLDFIKKDSLSQVLMDKDNRIEALQSPSDKGYYTNAPSKKDYDNTVRDFFFHAADVAKGLYRDQPAYALHTYYQLAEQLLIMAKWYVASQNGYGVNLGICGKALPTYLEEDLWDQYGKCVPSMDGDVMWTALFSAMNLFRKFSLGIAEVEGYDYPKQADVTIIKKIREIWQSKTYDNPILS